MPLSDFTTVPVSLALPAAAAKARVAPPTHFLFVREHDRPLSSDDDGDSGGGKASLFVANLPVDAAAATVKAFFNQLVLAHGNGGRVERVILLGRAGARGAAAAATADDGGEEGSGLEMETGAAATRAGGKRFADNTVSTLQAAASSRSAKIRRVVLAPALEEERRLLRELAGSGLPDPWAGLGRPAESGAAAAVVVFVDRPSLASALRACRAVSRRGVGGKKEAVEWPLSATFASGTKRYSAHYAARFPPPDALRASVNGYLTTFAALEAHRKTVQAALAAEPDEDGFVTVTKASRVGVSVADAEAAKARADARRAKAEAGMGSFYRFQVRERMREKDRRLQEGFASDVRRLREARSS